MSPKAVLKGVGQGVGGSVGTKPVITGQLAKDGSTVDKAEIQMASASLQEPSVLRQLRYAGTAVGRSIDGSVISGGLQLVIVVGIIVEVDIILPVVVLVVAILPVDDVAALELGIKAAKRTMITQGAILMVI